MSGCSAEAIAKHPFPALSCTMWEVRREKTSRCIRASTGHAATAWWGGAATASYSVHGGKPARPAHIVWSHDMRPGPRWVWAVCTCTKGKYSTSTKVRMYLPYSTSYQERFMLFFSFSIKTNDIYSCPGYETEFRGADPPYIRLTATKDHHASFDRRIADQTDLRHPALKAVSGRWRGYTYVCTGRDRRSREARRNDQTTVKP